MPLASGVPTIRYKVYARKQRSDDELEWVDCGHAHYTDQGATKCALRYYKAGAFYAPIVCFAGSGPMKVTSKGDWRTFLGTFAGATRVLSPEDYAAEVKVEEAAEAVKELLK